VAQTLVRIAVTMQTAATVRVAIFASIATDAQATAEVVHVMETTIDAQLVIIV